MEAGGGLVQLPQALKRIAKVAMRIGVIGLDNEGLRDEVDGTIVFSRLMGNDTKEIQGDGLVGIGLQDPLIDALGLGKTTLGMVPHPKVYGLLEGRASFPGRRAW